MIRQRQKIADVQKSKQGYSVLLQRFQALLKCGIENIEEEAKDLIKDNPFVEIQSNIIQGNTPLLKQESKNTQYKKSYSNAKEMTYIREDSIYDILESQINDSIIFPSKRSQYIAWQIIDNLSPQGFLEIDLEEFAIDIGASLEEIQSVRKRFVFLEPAGLGALNIQESMLFQLDALELENEELYELIRNIIMEPNAANQYSTHNQYDEAKRHIKRFTFAPGAKFWEHEPSAIPDIFILLRDKEEIDQSEDKGKLAYSINDPYYPKVVNYMPDIEDKNNDSLKKYYREIKNLQSALDLRKSTIEKIAKVLIIKQRKFFLGGDLIPMRLSDVAREIGYVDSTISRAIDNKYLECPWGKIMKIKSFFTTGIEGQDGDVSNATIKQFIENLIDSEDKKRPLSDSKILKVIKEKFKTQMERRTITKYRKAMGIPRSSMRKAI